MLDFLLFFVKALDNFWVRVRKNVMGPEIERTEDIERNLGVEAKTIEANRRDLVAALIQCFDLTQGVRIRHESDEDWTLTWEGDMVLREDGRGGEQKWRDAEKYLLLFYNSALLLAEGIQWAYKPVLSIFVSDRLISRSPKINVSASSNASNTKAAPKAKARPFVRPTQRGRSRG